MNMSAAPLPLPILQGERCLLRPLVAADAASLRRHADDPEVARRMVDGFPSPYTAEAAQAWCEREANSGAFGYVWGIVARGDAAAGPTSPPMPTATAPAADAVIGCIGLVPQTGWLRCNAELGYWLGASHWGRGVASDAVCQVVDWAFAVQPGLSRVFAGVMVGNDGSQAVLRRCGFAREGLLPQSAIKDGQVVDRVLWGHYRATVARRAANIDVSLASVAGIAMERA